MHDSPSELISYEMGDEDAELICPPRPAIDICAVCGGIIYGARPRCENCLQNAAALDGTVQPVTSISLYQRPSRLRDWLTFYKSGHDTIADPAATAAVTAIFRRFFETNAAWLERLRVDFAVVVPSTTRPAPHPLAVALSSPNDPPFAFRSSLTRTSAPLGHNQPSRTAFVADDDVGQARILLLDDVFTSGARAQSAAYALRARGADIVSLCVLGRRYNPGYSARSAQLFEAQKASRFEWNIDSR